MTKPAVVFADMDGTFLADDKHVPQENLRALDMLAAWGGTFVPCTGRPCHAVPCQVMQHPATRYAIGSNGAVVYDVRAQQNVHVTGMDKSKVLLLYERVCGLEATFDIFADGKVFAERARYEAMSHYGIDGPSLEVLRRVRIPVDETVPQIVARVHLVEKVTSFWRTEEDCAQLAQAVAEIGAFDSAHGHPKNFELQAKGVSKGTALVWLCAHMGVELGFSVAFGDEANDVSMLRAAGTGVAMANATEAVKAAADVCTVTNNEAGVARFLEQFC